MKLAVFSDVHANLEALDLFIVHSRSQEVDRYACLGDMIGYGPNPNECLERIRSLNNYNPEITAKKILTTDLPPECAYYLIR